MCVYSVLDPTELETQLLEFRGTPPPVASQPSGVVGAGALYSHPSILSRAPRVDRAMIAGLQQRLGDVQDELEATRSYAARLRDELMRLSPKALTRAFMPLG